MLEPELLSASIACASILDREFRQKMRGETDGTFVPKPDSLDLAKKLRRQSVRNIQEANSTYASSVQARALAIATVTGETDNLQNVQWAAKSIMQEIRLGIEGALFGNLAWNFVINPLRLPVDSINAIKDSGLEAFRIIKEQSAASANLSTIEEDVEAFKFAPNGARVDIVLTPQGPKVIEVNLNWVDSIQALTAFDKVIAGKTNALPLKLLTETLGKSRKLAIVNLAEGAGSRSAGPAKELDALVANLQGQAAFAKVECLSPIKTRPEYFANFDAFYLNGDPKMIRGQTLPDWLQIILERTRLQKATLFPKWRPSLDRKTVLIPASANSSTFAPTMAFTEFDLARLIQQRSNFYLKGESYSSKRVAKFPSPEFEALSRDAQMFPQEYVLQEEAASSQIGPMLGFDTSSRKPVFIENPRCKFNVWIIGGKVAGVMASISGNDIISDKDFNTIPIAI